MKKHILLASIALLSVLSVAAQNSVWPTEDAEWYYTYTDGWVNQGYSRIAIDRDTVINGHTCQVYSRTLEGGVYTGNYTPYSYYTDSYAILLVEDSILSLYREESMQFDTIMNFKAPVGASWEAPIHAEYCGTDTISVHTEVVSRTTEMINSVSRLKYTLLRQPPSGIGFGDYYEEYYQCIGPDQNFIINQICLLSDFSRETALRCYYYAPGTPDEFLYKPFSEECTSYPVVNTTSLSNDKHLRIVNNPVKDGKVHLLGVAAQDITALHIYDYSGKELAVQKVIATGDKAIQVEFDASAAGTYLLTLITGHETHHERLMIIH